MRREQTCRKKNFFLGCLHDKPFSLLVRQQKTGRTNSGVLWSGITNEEVNGFPSSSSFSGSVHRFRSLWNNRLENYIRLFRHSYTRIKRSMLNWNTIDALHCSRFFTSDCVNVRNMFFFYPYVLRENFSSWNLYTVSRMNDVDPLLLRSSLSKLPL